jgi:hypothetical protein
MAFDMTNRMKPTREEIRIRQRDAYRPVLAVAGSVYLIRAKSTLANTGYLYKIGMTRGDPFKRVVGIQSVCTETVEVIHIVSTAQALFLERKLHDLFDRDRVYGEWFKLPQGCVNQCVAEMNIGARKDLMR